MQKTGRKKAQKGPKMEKKMRKKGTERRPEWVQERKNWSKGEKKCPNLVRKLRPNVEPKGAKKDPAKAYVERKKIN